MTMINTVDAPPVELVPYVDNDNETPEDELPEVVNPRADSILVDGVATRDSRIEIAKNPYIHYKRDFFWLTPYFSGEVRRLPEWVGVDIETEVEDRPDIGQGWKSGLNPVHTAIACIQIEINADVYIVHWSSPNRLSSVPGIDLFRQLIGLPYVYKAIHNAEFEWKFLLNELGKDLVIESVWDTKLGENILSEGRGFTLTQGKYWVPRKDERPRKFLALGDCILRRYGYQMDKGLDVRLSFKRGEGLTDRQLQYAGDDAVWCRMLAEDQYADMCLLEQQGVPMLHTMYTDCEMVEAVGRMSLNGMYMEKAEAQKLWAEVLYEISQLTERLQKLFYLPRDNEPVLTPKTGKQRIVAGKPLFNVLNLNSEQQMVARLNQFGIAVEDYKASTLKHFKNHAGIDDILLVKQLDKLRGTYLEPFCTKYIHPQTSRIYCNLNLAVAATGRLSCSNPNLQQLPSRTPTGRKVRRLFKAKKGNVLVEADYSQIELKLIAEVYNDPNMIKAFCADMDLHALIGCVVLYGVADFSWDNLVRHYNVFYPKYKEGDPEHKTARQGGKPVNFGLGYGAGPKELQMIAWRDHNIWWELPYCKKLRNLYLGIWSGVRRYHYEAAQMCEKAAQMGRPVVAETLDGRRRWIDARTGYSAWLNHRIQGSSGDMTKRAINMMKRDVNLILTVHDSIMAEVPEQDAEATAKFMEEVMIHAGRHYLKKVPVTVDTRIIERWEKE